VWHSRQSHSPRVRPRGRQDRLYRDRAAALYGRIDIGEALDKSGQRTYEYDQ